MTDTEDADDADRPAGGDRGDAPDRVDRAVLDRMTDGFHAYDDEWNTVYINELGRKIVSLAAGEELSTADIVGENIWELVPEAVGTDIYDRYHESMDTGEQREFRTHYEPLDRWFEVRTYPDDSGLTVVYRDVTDEHERRERLTDRSTALRRFSEIIVEPDLTFEERVGELLELGRAALGIRYGVLSRIRDDEYHFDIVRAPEGDDAIPEGTVVDLESTFCERSVVRERTLVLDDVASDPELSTHPGFTEFGATCYLGTPVVVDGSVYGTFCFYGTEPRAEEFTDWQVTLVELMGRWVGTALEREQAQERLRRQNERLEEFATIVSHDLRNPLAVARGQADLVGRGDDGEHLEKVVNALDRMDQIVSDVLAMARTGGVVEETERVDLAAVARDAWETVETAEATLVTDDAPTVVADESRLRQLLENLFRNAVEHGGESVTVTVESIRDGFAVSDDGPGVPPEERDSVFDHGHTTSESGTGFGLSIVRAIAEAHGWAVDLAESADGGARFEFTGVDR